MNKIIEEIQKIKPSPSVFSLSEEREVGEDTFKRVRLSPIGKHELSLCSSSPLGTILGRHYDERFDSRVMKYVVIQREIYVRTVREIRESVMVLIDKCFPQKNPWTTPAAKWFKTLSFTEDARNDGVVNFMVGLYEYVQSDKFDVMSSESRKTFTELIKLMHQKYEKTALVDEYARRRRKRRR